MLSNEPSPTRNIINPSSRHESTGESKGSSWIRNRIRLVKDGWYTRWHTPDRAWSPWVLGLLLALAVFLVYSNTLHGPFQYDDACDIRDNLTIRHLWPLWDVTYIRNNGFMSRPVTNLSFAINYAIGGLTPFSYHLTNLIIHIAAALTLLGILRRTLSRPGLREHFGGKIQELSLVMTALWALHPLLTESVSYITQRYESLMALFVLLTFYCLVRMAESPSPRTWGMCASLTSFLALGSKEVAVSLPILVLLFDRTFLAGSFRGAWRKRRELYLGLLTSWACFGYIQSHLAGERTFAGFGLTLPWWRYAINQPNVLVHYLNLSVWPHPLNFDYFWPPAKSFGQLLPGILIIGCLLGLTIWSLLRKPSLAFLSVFFFFILSPTSSIMPILDLAVEHRMYLPLVPVVIAGTTLIYFITESLIAIQTLRRIVLIVTTAGALATFGCMTYIRNEDYQSPIDLWRGAVENAPNNPRAHHNYAFSLAEAGYTDEAIKQYDIAIKLAPNVPLFLCNYGALLGNLGRFPEALHHLRLAVLLEPTNYKIMLNLGVVHWQKGSTQNAIICFCSANRANPHAAMPYYALSAVMYETNHTNKAHELVQKAISIEPQNPLFQYQLGLIELKCGEPNQARKTFQRAIQFSANPETIISDVGWALHDYDMDSEAVTFLRQALKIKANHIKSQVRLAWILATSFDDSVRNGNESLFLAKDLLSSHPSMPPDLLDLLGVSLAESGRFPEAQAAIQLALSQSKDRKEKWVPEFENRLELFKRRIPYRDAPKHLIQTNVSKQNPKKC